MFYKDHATPANLAVLYPVELLDTSVSIPVSEMLEKIRKGQDPPFRPHIHVDENNGCTKTMKKLMINSWEEDPHCRLTMKQVKAELKEIIGPG